MSLEEKAKRHILTEVKSYYHKALENGAKVSEVDNIGPHLYSVKIGNMELTYMGTADGTARLVGASGNIA